MRDMLKLWRTLVAVSVNHNDQRGLAMGLWGVFGCMQAECLGSNGGNLSHLSESERCESFLRLENESQATQKA